MFGLIKKMFIVLLTSLVSASNHTKFVSLSNQKCMTQLAIYVKRLYLKSCYTCNCKNGKHLTSIIHDSVITCDEIIDAVEAKIVTTNFNEKNAICTKKNSIFYLPFY